MWPTEGFLGTFVAPSAVLVAFAARKLVWVWHAWAKPWETTIMFQAILRCHDLSIVGMSKKTLKNIARKCYFISNSAKTDIASGSQARGRGALFQGRQISNKNYQHWYWEKCIISWKNMTLKKLFVVYIFTHLKECQ